MIRNHSATYVVKAGRNSESKSYVIAGTAWDLLLSEGYLLYLDVVPTDWNGFLILAPEQNKNSSTRPPK